MLHMTKKLMLSICLLLSSCGQDNEELQSVRFDRNITIITRISGSGGTLGDERYRVSYVYKGQESSFFEGVNPKTFSLKKASSNKIRVKFCDGTVRLAQPIFLGPPYKGLIHLGLDLDCQD